MREAYCFLELNSFKEKKKSIILEEFCYFCYHFLGPGVPVTFLSLLEWETESVKLLIWWAVYQEKNKSHLKTAQETGPFHHVFVWKEELKITSQTFNEIEA